MYSVTMTVRYLDVGGNILAIKPISARVAKGTAAEMRTALVTTLKPLLDQTIIDLPDEVSGKTNIIDAVLTQVNTYLGTK
jgi:hypothetical protein